MDFLKDKNKSYINYNNILIIGDDKNNKTKLIKELLKNHEYIKDGLIITDNDKSLYSDLVSEESIETKYNQELTKQFMDKQKELKNKIQINKESEKEHVNDYRRFLILDDCIKDSDKSWQKDKNIHEVLMNGKTRGVFFVMCFDKAISIPPNLRANIDFIFIFESNKSNKKRLYEDYAGMFPTLHMFESIYNDCTKEDECLVINNCSPSPKLENQIYWYKTL